MLTESQYRLTHSRLPGKTSDACGHARRFVHGRGLAPSVYNAADALANRGPAQQQPASSDFESEHLSSQLADVQIPVMQTESYDWCDEAGD
jgi:hypothetical protein